MNSSIKLIIRKGKCSKDGNHTVFLQYCYTSVKRVLISTGISIPCEFWDKQTCSILQSLPPEYEPAKSLQDKLDNQRVKAEKIIRYAIKRKQGCPMQFLKRNFRLPDCWDLEQLEADSNDLSFFKSMEEDVEGVFLSWRELSKIYRLDMDKHPCLTKYRDLFIIGCLTGLRFSDYSTLNRNHLKDGMLHVRQYKTGDPVVIPLREDAKQILVDKYQMRLPRISLVNFSFYIKEVLKLAAIEEPVRISYKRGSQVIEETKPKYAWISSHTARRSFCTNEYLAGTPSDLIMAVSGHKTEKAFKKYIKVDHIKKASMIKKLWDDQPGL